MISKLIVTELSADIWVMQLMNSYVKSRGINPLRWLIFLLLFSSSTLYAQQNGAWLFLSHTQTLNKKFDILADIQMRNTDRLTYVNTILLRTAVNYKFNQNQSFAMGYAHKGDWEIEDEDKHYFPEHRIYQQYLHNFTFENIEWMVRGRLEQRFVKEGSYHFSQRARLLLSAQIPLVANEGFTQGIYANLQDEVFLNVHNKENVNGSFLDQNRPYVAAGYRFNKKIDMEIGYTRWFQRETSGDGTADVLQLMITTSF